MRVIVKIMLRDVGVKVRVILKIASRDMGVTSESDCKDNVEGHKCDR